MRLKPLFSKEDGGTKQWCTNTGRRLPNADLVLYVVLTHRRLDSGIMESIMSAFRFKSAIHPNALVNYGPQVATTRQYDADATHID